MPRRLISQLVPLLPATLAASVSAGDPVPWVSFANETASRLVAPPALVAADPEEKDYAWGDVDLDGDVDLVIVRKEPGSTPGRRPNVLLINVDGVLVDGTAAFASAADDGGRGFLDDTADRDVRLVDVDFDGWLDIVTATVHGQGLPKSISHARVYVNLGNDPRGQWLGFRYEEARIPELSEAPNAAAVAAGDVTGDHAPDLYFTTYNSNLEDHLLVNDRAGFFTDVSAGAFARGVNTSGYGISAEIADMNDDGWRDLVRCQSGLVDIIYNDGGGQFSVRDVVIGAASYHVATGELDGDGRLDLVVGTDGQDVYLLNEGNDGSGHAEFSTHAFTYAGGGFDEGFTGNILAADLDLDGHQDVLIADVDVDVINCNTRTHVFRNLADATPTLQEQQIGDTVVGIPVEMLRGTHDIAVFDLDGDGHQDLILGRCDSTEIWINQATCPADVNGDGAVDVQDLIAVILSWSSDDDDADINGDGIVNVLDLIEVIINDGPC